MIPKDAVCQEVEAELNVLPVFSSLAVGAALGSLLLGQIPVYWLEKIIGVAIAIFAVILLVQRNGNETPRLFPEWIKYAVSGFGGFLGGFIGITGPPLIIYMKMRYPKDFFRTQLIGVFFFGAAWRFMLYQASGLEMNLTWIHLLLFLGAAVIALIAGNRLHANVNEMRFNRIVAGLLLIPAFNLLFIN